MAKLLNGDKRGRPGKWLVDYYDSAGKRRLITADSRDEGKAALERVLRETRQQTAPACDPNITTRDYAARWLDALSVAVKPRSHESYSQNWRLHLEPKFGPVRVRKIQRGAIQGHLVGLLKAGMGRGTVKLVHSVMRAMLNAALADGLIASNPADRLGRQLKLAQTTHSRQDEIEVKALDRGQVSRLLAAATGEDWTLLLLLARTGLRVSEAIGLEWSDVDTDRRQITIARATSRGRTDTPKSGHGRVVDMSNQLAEALRRLLVERKSQTLKHGWGEIPRHVFCTRRGDPLTEDRIRATMARALKGAGLSEHLTPHCLRHTYASLMLQGGESPAYVQRMLGHASIKLTVDTYGKWLPMGNPAAANRLDDDAVSGAIGSKTVAQAAGGGGNAAQTLAAVGAGEEHNITGSWSKPDLAPPSHTPRPVNPANLGPAPCLVSLLVCPGAGRFSDFLVAKHGAQK